MSINLSMLKTKENSKDSATHLPIKYPTLFPNKAKNQKGLVRSKFQVF